MYLPTPHFRTPPEPETPAIVRVVSRDDVLWNRPVFKAPALVVSVPTPEQLFAGVAPIAAPFVR
ncbi:MAG: hypothetical protein JWM32_2350 [Verrucomicrobia bacterium]|nr:hypothetical protein [Verrucomicrobiota bacterium]